MKVHCPHDELVAISDVKAHPKNANRHPEEQIERLSKILQYQGFRYPVKVSRQSGYITSGHGRVLAAQLNGWDKVPVSYQDYESPEQELADLHADNAIASWAELDLSKINLQIPDLDPSFSLDMFGIQDFTLDFSEKLDGSDAALDLYTKKIKAPVYTPKRETAPPIETLVNSSKCKELADEITAALAAKKITEPVADFLYSSAARHAVFDYAEIAEFYAHADAETQNLMERSALVIIDFGKAIENGFVTMTQEIASVYGAGPLFPSDSPEESEAAELQQ